MVEADTKNRILDAAEQLFSERGIAGTSLRAITSEAGVNVAAVHYHFGSKEELTRAVVRRRVAPLNRDRLKLLAEAERAAAPRAPDVEAILEALFRPAVELWEDGDRQPVAPFLLNEPVDRVAALIVEAFGEVTRRFGGALERALPHLAPDELMERYQLAIGAMIHVLAGRLSVAFPGRPLPQRSADEMVRVLVRFAAPALRAPALASGRRRT